MSTFFMFCALVGGTFLICQLLMTLLGLGHGGLDAEISHGLSGSMSGHGMPDPATADQDADITDHHDSSWLFGIVSFRTLVAATTVFGLAGMCARTGGLDLGPQLILALAGGAAAMFAVHGLMRSLYQLSQNGTLQIRSAIGQTATVSISIPGDHAGQGNAGQGNMGQGKVRLTVQGRLEELSARNSQTKTLLPGSRVVVIDVVDGNILKVAPMQVTSM